MSLLTSCTWKSPVSAAPACVVGPPSRTSPPRADVSSPPAPYAEPPGSSSSVHDAAAAEQTKPHQQSELRLIYEEYTAETVFS